jgi:hypothetical protein
MSTSQDDSDLVRVTVGFEDHWADIDAETFWAKPLGNDRYELRNVPFYAYGLNFGDVVVARHDDEEPELLMIDRVERPGGHGTFRIMPNEDADPLALAAAIESLSRLGVGVERANDSLLAVDCPPEVDVDTVFDRLEELADEGVLEFETCERQSEIGFGPLPE